MRIFSSALLTSATLLYLLASLRDEILAPNGYTLDDLGIKTPS